MAVILSDKTVDPLLVTDGQSLTAFKGVTVADTNLLSNTETVSITLSQTLTQALGLSYYFEPTNPNVGSISDPNGGGTWNPATDTFTESGVIGGDPTFATDLLARLVYSAPALPAGQAFPTQASITVTDGATVATDPTPVVVADVAPPAITGTVTNEPIAADDKIPPFATAAITQPYFYYDYYTIVAGSPYNTYVSGTNYNYNSTESASIEVSDGGQPTDADGLLTGPGLSKTGVGTYSLGPAFSYNIQSELRALSFQTAAVAAGQTSTVAFELDVTDTTTSLATQDKITSLLVIGPQPGSPPNIVGTLAGQLASPGSTVDPFESATVSDTNTTPTDSATITVANASGASTDANGTLTGTSLTETSPGSGVYTLAAATPPTLTSELDALTFHPAALPAGVASEATAFSLSISDPSALPVTDSKTTVIETAPVSDVPPPPLGEVILHGAFSEYTIADDNGALYVQDNGSADDGTQTLPGVNEMMFTDGVGIFDPTGTAEDVARVYDATLDRAPDAVGVEYWAAQVDDYDVRLSAVANDFTTSPEFIQTYGSLSDSAFVNQLYQNVLGRSADAGGTQYWDGLLASGASRGTVVLGFAESQENDVKTVSTAGDENNAEAYRLYQAALNRTPDASGLSYWSSVLTGGDTPTGVAQAFINSPEFQQDYGSLTSSDFVSTLYQNVLHRAADPTGLQYWTSQLQQGASEASVLVGFSDSLENRVQTASGTHANWVFIPSS